MPGDNAGRMPRRLHEILFWFLVICVFAACPSALAQTIRVLLAEVTTGAEVRIEGAHRGWVDGAPRFDTPHGLAWPVAAAEGRLLVDGAPAGTTLALEPAANGFTFRGRRYRGSVTLTADGAAVRVVNLLPLDDYLRGVVPAEMHASWPLEALKAQAIAARTYTLSSLDPSRDWDICATIDCQVYEGRDAEDPRSDRAIAETAGLVLTYGGRFARTYYHSDSGGTVASSAEVWGTRAPYLVAVQDISTATPHRRWRAAIDGAAVGATVARTGRAVGTVTRLRVLATSESGRATSVEVAGTLGTAVLSGGQLTDALRSWGLKSTRFRMVGDLIAEGDGWGHGVGMSQYGARALAAAGYAYWQILGFYYPGTALQRLP